jgi:hypothetical protein
MERVDHDMAIHAIQRAGGVTSLAHLGRITSDNITIGTMVDQLTGAGIGTIELKYPCEDVMRVSTTILRSLARRKWPHLTICCERVDLIATFPTPESSELGALVFQTAHSQPFEHEQYIVNRSPQDNNQYVLLPMLYHFDSLEE